VYVLNPLDLSFVDVLQVCVSYFNLYETYNKRTYEMKGNDTGSFNEALELARSWNYDGGEAPIPLGKFYEVDVPYFDPCCKPAAVNRDDKIKEVLENFI